MARVVFPPGAPPPVWTHYNPISSKEFRGEPGRALRGWGLPFSKNYKRTSKPLFYYTIQAVVNCTLLVINCNASSHLTTRTPGTAISSTSPHQGSALPCNHWEISASVRLVSVRPGRVLG